MENLERRTEKTRTGAKGVILGALLGLGAIPFVNVGNEREEHSKITHGNYGTFKVEVSREKDRSVIIMRDGNTRIQGADYFNDGLVDTAEPIMGYRGTGCDEELLQSAYDSVRNR